ncbi:chorismate mutase [Jeotgalibacillus soli]|uniref:chorismate mutase n=1 Tax=Jeotgalibacillus soli TaxID=889306 RepID=A0A0C2VJM3_9BACL|nr:chorismate mutase [Jeotgalibacillus soli]KIL44198.1 chorismate mutase [Jeotgalibacillus soli]
MIRGIRGATTVLEDREDLILTATENLLKELIEENSIKPENIASLFISVTPDLTTAFPAKAVRHFSNWDFVPIMCMQEIPVQGGLPLCIRIMVHVNTAKPQDEINHIYQEQAIVLRPDLANTKSSK